MCVCVSRVLSVSPGLTYAALASSLGAFALTVFNPKIEQLLPFMHFDRLTYELCHLYLSHPMPQHNKFRLTFYQIKTKKIMQDKGLISSHSIIFMLFHQFY